MILKLLKQLLVLRYGALEVVYLPHHVANGEYDRHTNNRQKDGFVLHYQGLHLVVVCFLLRQQSSHRDIFGEHQLGEHGRDDRELKLGMNRAHYVVLCVTIYY